MKNKKLIEEFLSTVSEMSFAETAKYKYAKHIDYGSDKYKRGVIKSLTWISDLSAFYVQRIKSFEKEFLEILESKEKELMHIDKKGINQEYRRGLIDGIRKGREIIAFLKSNR